MNDTLRRLPNLSERGEVLVDYLKRYWLIFSWTASRLFSGVSDEAIRKFLERTRDDEWLVKHRFPGCGGSYWMLSRRACHRLELKRTSSALRQLPLIKHCLTALYFAVNPDLKLLTPAESRGVVPQASEGGNNSYYFLARKEGQPVRLGRLILDHGRRPFRIWMDAKEIASAAKAKPAFYELCCADGFYVAIATTTEGQAEKIQAHFDERPIRDIRVEVTPVTHLFPELLIPVPRR